MIHLETLTIWSLTALTVRVAGPHVSIRERHITPPSGEMAPPSGLAPHGSGSATLCETFGLTQLRSAKDKSIAHYVRSHKSVCNECVLACARTKDKSLAQRRVLCGLRPMYCPLRGQCH